MMCDPHLEHISGSLMKILAVELRGLVGRVKEKIAEQCAGAAAPSAALIVTSTQRMLGQRSAEGPASPARPRGGHRQAVTQQSLFCS